MHFYPADILLPDFGSGSVDGTKWAVIACDQHTSEPEYWERVERIVGDAPSTLRLMLPEIWLSESAERIPGIRSNMEFYINSGILRVHKDCGIYLERTLSGGGVRRGIIGCIDLEEYDYSAGSRTPVRSTERTVTDRIPPRLAVRRGAPIEMPHILLLMDDPEDRVLGPFRGRNADAYSFELMEGGGYVKGSYVDASEFVRIEKELENLSLGITDPIVFAVGDGNHSLATAKAAYEELKKSLGVEQALHSPARFALAEAVNIHDSSIQFEPIYRLCSSNDTEFLIEKFKEYARRQAGPNPSQIFTIISGGRKRKVKVQHPVLTLPVATLQTFLDSYSVDHPDLFTDYIHGAESLERLASKDGFCGFLFEGMGKSDLFPAVEKDGNLPRKTFSMGQAEDKRYYIESRKIV